MAHFSMTNPFGLTSLTVSQPATLSFQPTTSLKRGGDPLENAATKRPRTDPARDDSWKTLDGDVASIFVRGSRPSDRVLKQAHERAKVLSMASSLTAPSIPRAPEPPKAVTTTTATTTSSRISPDVMRGAREAPTAPAGRLPAEARVSREAPAALPEAPVSRYVTGKVGAVPHSLCPELFKNCHVCSVVHYKDETAPDCNPALPPLKKKCEVCGVKHRWDNFQGRKEGGRRCVDGIEYEDILIGLFCTSCNKSIYRPEDAPRDKPIQCPGCERVSLRGTPKFMHHGSRHIDRREFTE